MIPDSATAIAAHTKAVGLLFQKYSPELYKTGLFHRLFVGFRPLMVCGFSPIYSRLEILSVR